LDDLLSLLGDRSLRSARYDLVGARLEIEPWYHLSDGRAAERVADFLLSRLAKKKHQARKSLGVTLSGGRPNPNLRRYLLGGLSLVAGSYMASWMVDRLRPARLGKHIDYVAVQDLIFLFHQLDVGSPEFQVNRLHSPIAGQPLSSLSICML
jgi:hypothetical protein